jgi:hypothetical protein
MISDDITIVDAAAGDGRDSTTTRLQQAGPYDMKWRQRRQARALLLGRRTPRRD